jgi:hypothetical protein
MDESQNRAYCLSALAIATTRYHEAAPDRIEQARIQYEEALCQFKTAQADSGSGEINTVCSARTLGGSVLSGFTEPIRADAAR